MDAHLKKFITTLSNIHYHKYFSIGKIGAKVQHHISKMIVQIFLTRNMIIKRIFNFFQLVNVRDAASESGC